VSKCYQWQWQIEKSLLASQTGEPSAAERRLLLNECLRVFSQKFLAVCKSLYFWHFLHSEVLFLIVSL